MSPTSARLHVPAGCANNRHIPEAWLRETVMELIRQRLFLRPASD